MDQPRKPRLVCVDRDPPCLDSLREVLEAAGRDTRSLARVTDSHLSGVDPDVLVLALGPDDPDGWAGLATARDWRDREGYVPIVVVLEAGHGPLGVQALKGGADEVLELPLPREALLARVEALLRVKGIQDRMVRSRRELERMASKDPTTGVLTRPQWEGRLREELERARRYHEPLSVILVDLLLADSGQVAPADKRLMRVLARTLQAVVRGVDQVGRHGGTSFGVLLPSTHLAGALAVAERLDEAAATLILEEEPGQHYLAAQGLAFFPARGVQGHDDLLRFAGEALQRARSRPEERICLYQATHYFWQPPGRRGPQGG